MGIRELRPGDQERLAPLLEELGYQVAPRVLAERIPLITSSGQASWVSEDERGALDGWLHAQARPSLLTESTIEITAVVVAPGARRAGIGRALVEQAEHWAVARGIRRLVLRSQIARSEAHRFYETLGYARHSTSHTFLKTL
jgi:GNAT superfamily N-acetyltransferase